MRGMQREADTQQTTTLPASVRSCAMLVFSTCVLLHAYITLLTVGLAVTWRGIVGGPAILRRGVPLACGGSSRTLGSSYGLIGLARRDINWFNRGNRRD